MKTDKMKHVLYNPISPYFIGIYSTLISIVQGIAIGGLFFILSEAYPEIGMITFAVFLKILICLLVVCLIWHRYVTHFQFLAWQLTIMDAIIPFGFAILQSFMVVSIKEDLVYFSLSLTLIFIWGLAAYLNVFLGHFTDKAFKVFKSHYKAIDDNFADILFYEIHSSNKQFLIQMVVTVFLYAIFTMYLYYFSSTGENNNTYLLTFISAIVFLYLYIFDLPKMLRSSSTLASFGIFNPPRYFRNVKKK